MTLTMTASECFMLTPAGALHAFSSKNPDPDASALQALLTGERSLDMTAWSVVEPLAPSVLERALESGWVQVLQRSLQGPDARLDDFLQYVIASLSGDRRAVLASDAGFCLGRAGAAGRAAQTTWRFTTTLNSCSLIMSSCRSGLMARVTG